MRLCSFSASYKKKDADVALRRGKRGCFLTCGGLCGACQPYLLGWQAKQGWGPKTTILLGRRPDVLMFVLTPKAPVLMEAGLCPEPSTIGDGHLDDSPKAVF